GFDEATLPESAPANASYRSYLLGLSDGVRKSPEWAAPLCGIPAEKLRSLAIEYATSKPAALHCGYAPGRTINGEQFHRAAYALAAITGNIGIAGGNSGVSNGATGRGGIKSFSAGVNPAGARVASSMLADLLDRGKAGGYPADIKMIYSVCGNLFNQVPNVRKTIEAAKKVEFIVAHEHFLTPTAQYADIVLPATTFWERNDMHTPWAGGGHYVFYMKQAVTPTDECRNDLDICADLAKRLGIDGYNDKSEEQWLRELSEDVIDDFETFRAQGLARLPAPEDAVAFAKQIRDPENHPFTTPSGKIEIYATRLAENQNLCGLGPIPPIPTWIPDPPDPKHPLQLCSPKSRARTHSIHGNQPTLARADKDDVWINTVDAAARGVVNGQIVRVFNDRGSVLVPARVTDRIAPGVVSIKDGAWYRPNEDGADVSGCANVLTSDRAAPSGASTYNSNFVEIAPA
ncbi:MAG TPA: molybdopterin dinucleotide binding domain-containing protein, partial [Terriglobales bacterium]|nr:molybdopterin dinucleotide binding domain-containing protein [Terriglobales bacterium]